jgi:hypothetical protein
MIHRHDNDESYYAIHEVYYGVDGPGSVCWTDNPIAPCEGTIEELRETLERMLRALDQPVLEYSKYNDAPIEDRWDD